AERINMRSIRAELVRALEHWSSLRRRTGGQDGADWKKLLAIARTTDPDPYRNQLRDALVQGDMTALDTLIRSADVSALSPATLFLLGFMLAHDFGAMNRAIAFLREAQRQHPSDVWINGLLGEYCLRFSQYDDALRYSSAALAVRPDNPSIRSQIGHALVG